MKKLFPYITVLLTSVLFTACNLFIEEEDDFALKTVPVHTGDGYDTPVTLQDGDCVVTYQFKSNVRQVSREDVDRYITSVEFDITSALVEIHYAGSTPADKLPHEGEILLCSFSHPRFPYGLNHLVQAEQYEEGTYKYLCTFASLTETYEELDIDGSMITTEKNTFSRSAVDMEDEWLQHGMTRGAQDGGEVNDTLVSFDDKGFTIKVGIETKLPLGKSNNKEVSVNLKGEYSMKNEFNFDDFSLKDMNLTFKFIQTTTTTMSAELDGEIKAEKLLKAFHPIKGKPFTVGPVLIVFFLDINLVFEANVKASIRASKEKIDRTTYIIDLYNLSVNKEVEDLSTKDWSFNANLFGSVGLRLDFIFGFGVYGKVLSVRFVPQIWLGVEAELNLPFSLFEDRPLDEPIDASAGLTFRGGLKISGKIGVAIDLSLEALLGPDASKAIRSATTKERKKDEARTMLAKVSDMCNENSDAYKNLSEQQRTAADDINNNQNELSDLGVYINIGPWPFMLETTWFPKIEDHSFVINKVMSSDKKKLEFTAQFRILKEGLFSKTGGQRNYVAGLMITQGDKVIDVLYPTNGGQSAWVVEGQTYYFKIPNYEDDQLYKASPCYMRFFKQPDVLDKGLPFSSTTPMVVTQFFPGKVEGPIDIRYNSYSFEGADPETQLRLAQLAENSNYLWVFHATTRTTVRGMENIAKWVVDVNNERHTNAEFTADSDGSYTYHWKAYNFYDEPIDDIAGGFRVFTSYFLKKSDGTQDPNEIKVSDESIWMHSKTQSNATRRIGDEPNKTFIVLESVEKDGKTVWQNPDCPPDDWSEDEETPFVLHHF